VLDSGPKHPADDRISDVTIGDTVMAVACVLAYSIGSQSSGQFIYFEF